MVAPDDASAESPVAVDAVAPATMPVPWVATGGVDGSALTVGSSGPVAPGGPIGAVDFGGDALFSVTLGSGGGASPEFSLILRV